MPTNGVGWNIRVDTNKSEFLPWWWHALWNLTKRLVSGKLFESLSGGAEPTGRLDHSNRINESSIVDSSICELHARPLLGGEMLQPRKPYFTQKERQNRWKRTVDHFEWLFAHIQPMEPFPTQISEGVRGGSQEVGPIPARTHSCHKYSSEWFNKLRRIFARPLAVILAFEFESKINVF
jgi:hypothetical protein